MKTLDLEILTMKYFGIRRNLIVPNVSWGLDLHECDMLILSKSNYATEVEIKVSKSDLLKDKEKFHGHLNKKIRRLFFCVPENLKEVALANIPERAGLLIPKEFTSRCFTYEKGNYDVTTTKLIEVRGPIANKYCQTWSASDREQLSRLGAMRILGLKEKIQKLQQN
jgi:hypothetical protein